MGGNDDAIIGLGLLIIGLALIIYGLVIFMVIWAVVSAVVGYIQYRKYLDEAEEEVDEIRRELGVDLSVEEILETVMGVEVPDAHGFETAADWMAGIPLGATEEWPN